MPFEFVNKLRGQKDKVAAEADAKAEKSSLRGKDFASQTEALKPPADKDPAKKKGPMAQIKSVLGLGKSDKDSSKEKPDKNAAKGKKGAPDPALIKLASNIIGQAQNAAGIAGNIAKRVPQMAAEIAADGTSDYFAKVLERSASLSGWSAAIMASTQQLEDAFDKFVEDGNVQAFIMAADAVLNEVLALRIELSGLAGPGDSLSPKGLIMHPQVTDKDLVGGLLVGKNDAAAKGITPPSGVQGGTAIGGMNVLPTANNSVSGQAIRVQGTQYMQYADELRAAIQAMR